MLKSNYFIIYLLQTFYFLFKINRVSKLNSILYFYNKYFKYYNFYFFFLLLRFKANPIVDTANNPIYGNILLSDVIGFP
ncbi:hypothetical protein UT300013_29140 [Paraclostridium sordellii]